MSRLVLHSLDPVPVHQVRSLNARRGGGRESALVPIVRGVISGLPGSLDGLILASDLQGRVPDESGELHLTGVAVAEVLEGLSLEGAVPPLDRCGVVLAGDLFSVPDASKRGGFGDVEPVWRAFQQRCAWVVGVAGNHDDVSELPRGTHLLDSETMTIDGLRLGGVGFICGNPSKPGRRAEADQLAAIELVTAEQVDLLVLHEGPRGGDGQQGHELIPHEAPFVVCGHVHWDEPVYRHSRGVVLNVDARVVVLSKE
jgi:3',5'-cyclic-AMP phosphodiesterase